MLVLVASLMPYLPLPHFCTNVLGVGAPNNHRVRCGGCRRWRERQGPGMRGERGNLRRRTTSQTPGQGCLNGYGLYASRTSGFEQQWYGSTSSVRINHSAGRVVITALAPVPTST
jgi:hypothetical protein